MPQLTNTKLGLTDNAKQYGGETWGLATCSGGSYEFDHTAVLRKFEKLFLLFIYLILYYIIIFYIII